MGARVGQVPAVVALVSALAVILGSMMPWETLRMSFGSTSINGTTGDGQISLVIGMVAGVIALYALIQGRSHQRILLAVCGVIALGLSIIEWVRITDSGVNFVDSTFTMTLEVGIGIYVIAAGGIGLLVSSLLPAKPR